LERIREGGQESQPLYGVEPEPVLAAELRDAQADVNPAAVDVYYLQIDEF
jgi:hypothetical protein